MLKEIKFNYLIKKILYINNFIIKVKCLKLNLLQFYYFCY